MLDNVDLRSHRHDVIRTCRNFRVTNYLKTDMCSRIMPNQGLIIVIPIIAHTHTGIEGKITVQKVD